MEYVLGTAKAFKTKKNITKSQQFANNPISALSTTKEEGRNTDLLLKSGEQLIDDSSFSSKNAKDETDHRLDMHTQNLKFILDELLKLKDRASQQQSDFIDSCKVLDDLNTYFQNVLVNMTKMCIDLRQNITQDCSKQNVILDLSSNTVQKELCRELNVVTAFKERLEKSIADLREQLRKIRAVIYAIDQDSMAKQQSLLIDETNYVLSEIQTFVKECNVKTRNGTPAYKINEAGWLEKNKSNIKTFTNVINGSAQLLLDTDDSVKNIKNDILKQINHTNDVLAENVKNLYRRKSSTEDLHRKTILKVNELTETITRLENELQEKQKYMKLCSLRKQNRTLRPSSELYKDDTDIALQKEQAQLTVGIENLMRFITNAKMSLDSLLESQRRQEKEMNCLLILLKLDETDVGTVRSNTSLKPLVID